MEEKEYFINKTKRRINIFVIFCAVVLALCYFLIVIPSVEEGSYKESSLFAVPLIMIGYIGIYTLVMRLLTKLAFKNKKSSDIAVLLGFLFTGILVFWFLYPAIKYTKGEEADQKYVKKARKKKDKILIATIKAYQKAWMRQTRKQRIGKPLLILAIVAVAIYALYYLGTNHSNVLTVILVIVFIIAYILVVRLMGGVEDIKVKHTTYDVSVGTGWFDYGEVYVTEGASEIKDDIDINFFSLLFAIPLTFAFICGALLVGAIYLCVMVVKMFIPKKGMKTIFLHKKTAIGYDYIPGSYNFKKIMFLFNKLMYFLFGFNFVNEDFWLDGVGADYIYKYLSRENKYYLEDQLAKVDKKYGCHYDLQ